MTQLGVMRTPWMGAPVVLGALALTCWSGRLDAREGIAAGMAPRVAQAL